MASIMVDDKGRIIIPEDVRKKLGIRKGSKVKVNVNDDKVVITFAISSKQFIEKMEGFIKEGSKVEKVDPLKLKEIWLV